MNVYDFDKTIYDGDSSVHFYLFNLRQQPSLCKYVPSQLWALIQYKMKKIDKTQMKTIIYRYFQSIQEMDKRVEDFWRIHQSKIQPWYTNQKAKSDVIISASPSFLLKPITDELGIGLIASEIDLPSGKNLRPNCYGEEKVVRFKEQYDINEIDTFYSDSRSDDPMARLAKKAVLVKKDRLKPW